MEAMQAQTVDVVKRMKEITLVMKTPEEVLQAQGVSPSDLEGSMFLIPFVVAVSHFKVSADTTGNVSPVQLIRR